MSTDNQRSIYNLDVAYELACEKLGKVDIEQQCQRSGAQCRVRGSEKHISIDYLNQPHLIILPEIDVSQVDSDESVPLREKILILHYFTQAKGTAASNELIAFRQLPGGNIYHPTFVKRTIKPLTDYFGEKPAMLVKATERLGGYKAEYGDTGITINAFSRVPIAFALWHGDEELAPQLNLLFDATVSDYLETEDVTIVCETITWKLVSYLREAQESR